MNRDAPPLLLLDEAARQKWMNAPMEEAAFAEAPAAGSLKIVAKDTKEDGN